MSLEMKNKGNVSAVSNAKFRKFNSHVLTMSSATVIKQVKPTALPFSFTLLQ